MALVAGLEIELEGDPDFGLVADVGDVEGVGDDADDPVGLVAELDGLADRAILGGEAATPE